jgi:hypothetical protein
MHSISWWAISYIQQLRMINELIYLVQTLHDWRDGKAM